MSNPVASRAWKYLAAATLVFCAANSVGSAQEKLLFTSLSPAGGGNSIFFNAWAQQVNDRSNGALKIEVRDGVTLANYGNVYDRVQDDVVQIGWAIHQVIGGKFPLSEVGGLPFVSAGGSEAATALWQMNKSGLLSAEYKDIVPLVFVVFGAAQIHYGKVPKTVDDLAGLKVGVQGRVPSQLIAQLSGTPISIQPGDMVKRCNAALSRCFDHFPGRALLHRLQEVTAAHLEGPLGSSTSMFSCRARNTTRCRRQRARRWRKLPSCRRRASSACTSTSNGLIPALRSPATRQSIRSSS